HGLEGDSKRYYITRLANHLHQRGFTTVAVNFRSCGGILNRNRRFYHSGETEDPMQVIKWASEQFPGSNLFAAGFSLGGSALLNFLKRYGDDQPLTAAAAISVPFDLKRGSLNLENGFNRIYSLRFLRTLEEKLRNKRERFPDLPSFTGSTLYDFDDQVTGPIHGFKGADDYYQQCSSAFFMDQIVTKTLIVHSMQDPMCPYQWVPIDEIRKNPNLTPAFTEEGGHVGFWSLPPGWLNKSIGDYFSGHLRNRSAL
ncbi:MAG: alpha/beta fold hydrolase, partial [Balneolaceae bacterium]|nr:alpha/beta fold hydrolase [Balneolaceae bacterium]